MADNKLAYGLAKQYGIDTAGMSPKEVWEALEKKGCKELGGHKDENLYKSADELKEQQAKELKEESPKVKFVAHKVMQRVSSFIGKPVGTYDYNTGKQVELTDGYMVTFHQNEPDEQGHYKSHYGRYSEDEYDKQTENFVNENNAEVFIGVFDDEPEVSFKVKTFEQAIELMKKNNQKSIWDNAVGASGLFDEAYIENVERDISKNPMKDE